LPGDTCPDNNVFTGDGAHSLALIDFEGASWRHIAWDVAYLTVPWPSCWCSWRPTGDLASRAVARYRQAMAATMPCVSISEFDLDLAAATDLWSVLYSAWLLPLTHVDDPPASRLGLVSPRRRALLLHRLDRARQASMMPGRLIA
jgi:hypothetical protein